MGLASDILQKVGVGRDAITQSIGTGAEFIRKNPVTSAVGVAGGVLAGGTIVQIIRKKRKAVSKIKAKRKVARPKRKIKVHKHRKGQKRPHTAGRRKDTSTKRIRFTKNNQPYVIMASGKARFIKKSSVARMRKRKGGKY